MLCSFFVGLGWSGLFHVFLRFCCCGKKREEGRKKVRNCDCRSLSSGSSKAHKTQDTTHSSFWCRPTHNPQPTTHNSTARFSTFASNHSNSPNVPSVQCQSNSNVQCHSHSTRLKTLMTSPPRLLAPHTTQATSNNTNLLKSSYQPGRTTPNRWVTAVPELLVTKQPQTYLRVRLPYIL